eukprot:510659-Prymnesium_polylepis.1
MACLEVIAGVHTYPPSDAHADDAIDLGAHAEMLPTANGVPSSRGDAGMLASRGNVGLLASRGLFASRGEAAALASHGDAGLLAPPGDAAGLLVSRGHAGLPASCGDVGPAVEPTLLGAPPASGEPAPIARRITPDGALRPLAASREGSCGSFASFASDEGETPASSGSNPTAAGGDAGAPGPFMAPASHGLRRRGRPAPCSANDSP